MFNMNKRKNKKGFTLIETLIAIAIMALLAVCVASLVFSMLRYQERNRSIAEVEYAKSSILYDISQSIRNSNSVSIPAIGATSSSLTLLLPAVSSLSPTIYSIASSTVFVSYAGGSAKPISNTDVEVTSLLFQNITTSGTKGSVRITLGLRSKNYIKRPDLSYSTTAITTVSIR